MSNLEQTTSHGGSRRRAFVRARTLVAVGTVIALAGVVAVAPAAWAVPPDAPGQPAAVAGNGTITVTFAAAATGDPATSYVATCTSSDGGATGSATDTGSPILVSSLNNGHSYTCTVVASNVDGPSAPSADSNAVTPVAPTTVPDPPAQPNVVAGDARVTVTFSAPASNGGLAITKYTITCTAQSDGTNIVKSSATVTPVNFLGLINGETYTCTVTAHNANGDGPSSPASNPVTPAVAGHVPAAPAKPLVSSGDGQITVSFGAPADGGSPITGYTANCVSFGGVPGSAEGGGSPIVIFGLDNGRSYACTVFASNGLGDGPASAASAVVIPSRVPDAPTPPSVFGGDQRITVNFAAPYNGGSAITKYKATCTDGDGLSLSTTSTTPVPIVVTGLNNGVTYTCAVTASNIRGEGPSSADSQPVVPNRGPDTPAPPVVTAGDAQIKVAFRAPGNGGSPILAYGATCTSSNGGRRGTRSGTTTPLIVTGLTNGKTYTCTVAARNARGLSLSSPPSVAVIPSSPLSATSVPHGFRLFAGDGGVFTFGNDRSFGSAAGLAQHLVVGMATTTSSQGYWLVATDGGIFSFGDARFFGSTGAIHLNKPIVGMTPTPTGNGYWLVASDGGIFSYGDARFFGSTGAIHLNQPIVGMTSTPTGHGYWMVASDGGIFSFGDADFFGSPVGSARAPVVGMATTAEGHGYWIAAADGSVFHFGDAAALGGVTARVLRLPVRGIASTRSGRGYWIATGDGGVFTFGDAPYIGWPGPLVLLASIRGVSR